MASNRLQLYRGPCEAPRPVGPQSPTASGESVSVLLEDVLPWLADAVIRKRAWLNDFRDEAIMISKDLYEVIQAYRCCHRPSA
jgi:hypothetical protein